MSQSHQWFGFLNVDKPAGWTSRKVVDHVKRLIKPAKVGHAGTLDPLATGVLVLCLGPATRLVPYVQNLHKVYRAQFRFGCRSPSDDVESEIEAIAGGAPVTRDQIEANLPRFLGTISQIPPAFSAVKVRGRRAYELARKGRSVPLKAREVRIDSLQVIGYDDEQLTLDVTCGSGTYIRSLGRDLAESLGTGAVMTALTRLSVGPYSLQAAVSPDEITKESVSGFLQPPQSGLAGLPALTPTSESLGLLRRGLRIGLPASLGASEGDEVIVQSPDGRLAVIAEVVGEELQPRSVFPTD